jgi:hypothetical protein
MRRTIKVLMGVSVRGATYLSESINGRNPVSNDLTWEQILLRNL